MKAAILGATGYTGLELTRILSRHPKITVSVMTSERYAGMQFSSVYPALHGLADTVLETLIPEKIAPRADIVFCALPHKEAMGTVPFFISKKKKIIDLSADFRFSNTAAYEKWYQRHTAPELLKRSVYGLPELYRKSIASSQLVGNPGCYPTSIILPLAPLLKENMLSLQSIIADAKSGVSGAGRSLKTESLFAEVSEGLKAYNILQHRHQPEIEEQISTLSGKKATITFSPHLVPMNRGILSTVYASLNQAASLDVLHDLFHRFYDREPFVRVLPPGVLPNTGWVRGTNYCDIGIVSRGRKVVLVSAIDNLVKGAAGQAVQNMNIMLGYNERTALESLPLYP